MKSPLQHFHGRTVLLTALVAWAAIPSLFGAADPATAEEKQRKQISVLQSEAPPGEKAIACKRLAIYGTAEAVPVLAPLLANDELASWARIALEAIPGPAADAALRDALPKLSGRLLVGAINSIGIRRDAQAVEALTAKLKDADAEIASAAAEALGRIGGPAAARVLEQALANAANPVRAAVGYGAVLCAERFLGDGKFAEAVKLYDAVRQANMPKQRLLEATRGAILARQAAGLPLLLEQLRSADKALFGIGLRTARELPGAGVAEALATELERAPAERQVPLFLALADRRDPAVLPKILQVAKSGSPKIRGLALGMLDQLGDVSCVPVLLAAAAESDAEIAKIAKATLARLGGKEVDADLLGRLGQATGKTRQVLLELAKLRRIAGALPVALRSVDDADKGIRRAALDAVGILGAETEATQLARLLGQTKDTNAREDLEQALLAICGRVSAPCLPAVRPLMQQSDSALRNAGLHALAAIGGAEALAAVKAALEDKDEAVQDEAVRTLSNWPNTWPKDTGVAEPLLSLAKSGKKLSHQVQGLRGYLQCLQEDKDLGNDDKLAKLNQALPLCKRPEDKQLAISVLSGIPVSGTVELLVGLADDRAVAEEACQALVRLATGNKVKGLANDLRRKALQTAAEKAKNEGTRKKAEDALGTRK